MNDFCLIVDDEVSIQDLLSTILRNEDVPARSCSTVEAMVNILAACSPRLIFLDAALERSDAVAALRRLAASGYRGAVQLVSGCGPEVLEALRQAGRADGLRMLPPLRKPFRVLQVRQILIDEGLIKHHLIDATETGMLAGAEFGCKPLFRVRQRTLAGVEARVRIGRAGAPFGDAQEYIAQDAEALMSVLGFCCARFAGLARIMSSVDAPVSVVVPARIRDLSRVNIASLIFKGTSDPSRLSWLTVALTEDELFADLQVTKAVMLQLRIQGINIRVQNPGARLFSIAADRDLPVQEAVLAAGFALRGETVAAARLGKMVETLKQAGIKTIATGSEALALGQTGFDLCEDLKYEKLSDIASFVKKWSRRPLRIDNAFQGLASV